MRFLGFINEKLPISIARDFRSIWNPKTWDKMFGDKYRIYIELEQNKKEVDIKPKPEVQIFLNYLGYEIIDYKEGLCKKKGDKRIYKIGKVLAQAEKSNPGHLAPTAALRSFQKDPNRDAAKQKNLMVVISRHPYDIAGMSTDRGWTSCMSLDPDLWGRATAKDHIPCEIKEGSIIAYVIKSDDKNIKNPICRMMVRAYVGQNSFNVMLVPSKIYGANVPGFKNTVEKWLKKNNKVLDDTYRIAKGIYKDDQDVTTIEKITWGKPKILNVFKDILKLKPTLIKELLLAFYNRVIKSNKSEFKLNSITIPNLEVFLNSAGPDDFIKLIDKKITLVWVERLLSIIMEAQNYKIELQELMARIIIDHKMSLYSIYAKRFTQASEDERTASLDLFVFDDFYGRNLPFMGDSKLKKEIYDRITSDILKKKDLI